MAKEEVNLPELKSSNIMLITRDEFDVLRKFDRMDKLL